MKCARKLPRLKIVINHRYFKSRNNLDLDFSQNFLQINLTIDNVKILNILELLNIKFKFQNIMKEIDTFQVV